MRLSPRTGSCLTVSPGGALPCVLQVQGNPGTGGGVIAYTSVESLDIEGITLLSYDTAGAVGGGSFLGLYPDPLTAAVLSFVLGTSPAIGNPLHWSNAPGVFPNAPFVIPPGVFPPNQVVDFVGVKISATSVSVSNVARGSF